MREASVYRVLYRTRSHESAISFRVFTGQAGSGARVGWIGIDVIRTALCGPRLSIGQTLAHVEDSPAADVVIDDPVGQSIQLVTLAHEFAADGVHFGWSDPVRLWFLVKPDANRRELQ